MKKAESQQNLELHSADSQKSLLDITELEGSTDSRLRR